MLDHFVEWEEQGLKIDVDEAEIMRSWHKPSPGSSEADRGLKWRGSRWWGKIGNLPPPMRYRFPLNYVSITSTSSDILMSQIIVLLFPIMLPVVIGLM